MWKDLSGKKLSGKGLMKEIAKDFKEGSAIDETTLCSVLEECELKMASKIILLEMKKSSIWLMLNTDVKGCIDKLQSSNILIKVSQRWELCTMLHLKVELVASLIVKA